MASITDILNIARSGIQVQSKALRITGQNVSNVNTEGYSRQRVDIVSQVAAGSSSGIGASVSEIHRVYDSFLEGQVNRNLSSYGFLEGRQLVASNLESVFPELGDDNINASLSDFFNAFRTLADNPSGVSERQVALNTAETLANRFNRAYNSLESIQSGLNTNIRENVSEANGLLRELADLNKKIATVNDPSGESSGAELRDRRDGVVRQLSEMLPISTFTDGDGHVNVMLDRQVLVQGVQAGTLTATNDPLARVEMTGVGGVSRDITQYLAEDSEDRGRIAGMLAERDVHIEDTKSRLDQLAFTLAEQVNTLHSAAFGLDGGTGRNFFEPLAAVDGAAGRIRVSQELLDNPERLALAQDPLSLDGDNRAAMAIADLESDDATMGSAGFHDYFAETIGEISGRLSGLNADMEYQGMVVDQSEAFRASVSGVSIDEEMVSLIQFQRAFEASAKMLSTVDEMLSTVLQIK